LFLLLNAGLALFCILYADRFDVELLGSPLPYGDGEPLFPWFINGMSLFGRLSGYGPEWSSRYGEGAWPPAGKSGRDGSTGERGGSLYVEFEVEGGNG